MAVIILPLKFKTLGARNFTIVPTAVSTDIATPFNGASVTTCAFAVLVSIDKTSHSCGSSVVESVNKAYIPVLTPVESLKVKVAASSEAADISKSVW